MSDGAVIMQSRTCARCEYDLKGLRIGGDCPECGTQIRSRPKTFGAREGSLADAEPRYVRTLRDGFRLMSAGIIMAIVGGFVDGVSLLLGTAISLLASLAWAAGIVVVTRPRPPEFAERNDPVLDGAKMRTVLRACGGVWVVYTALFAAYEALSRAAANGGGNNLLELIVIVLAALAGIGAYISLVPLCVFLSDMSFWMSDDQGGWRLRGAAWTMAVFGSVNLVCNVVYVAGAPFLMFFAVWASIIVFIATLVFGWAVIECGRMASYTLDYQDRVEGRAERISAKIRERTEARLGVNSSDMECRDCGYNLRGLPHGGNCPECGRSYADITPPPMPRRTRPVEDSPIGIDEQAPVLPIVARMPSIGRDARADARGGQLIPPVDDNTPIPLASGGAMDDDRPEDMQDQKNRQNESAYEQPIDDDDAGIPLADEDGDDTQPGSDGEHVWPR